MGCLGEIVERISLVRRGEEFDLFVDDLVEKVIVCSSYIRF